MLVRPSRPKSPSATKNGSTVFLIGKGAPARGAREDGADVYWFSEAFLASSSALISSGDLAASTARSPPDTLMQ